MVTHHCVTCFACVHVCVLLSMKQFQTLALPTRVSAHAFSVAKAQARSVHLCTFTMTRTPELPAVVVDIAIQIIVEELRVYLGMRPDVSTADIESGFDALCGVVVGACYAAITEAERKLVLHGDLEAFDLELKRFARAAGRKWADTVARDVTDLDRA